MPEIGETAFSLVNGSYSVTLGKPAQQQLGFGGAEDFRPLLTTYARRDVSHSSERPSKDSSRSLYAAGKFLRPKAAAQGAHWQQLIELAESKAFPGKFKSLIE
jgi:hypothetical protein